MDAIRRSDSFVDALAGGRPVGPQDPADAELAALLGSWRDELRWPPATGLISESDAIAALNAGLAEKRTGPARDRWASAADTTPRRSRRGLSVLGAAAAAVLCIGGFGAVVAGAGPGDALYGLRTMMFGAPKEVRDDQVALAAQTELNEVQDLISSGNWDQAQDRLVAVSTQVAIIGDEQQKQDLLDQFNDLSAKVVERDPEATAPPGIVYTVPPSSAELVPALAPPTSTPSAPSLSESTTPSTSATTSTMTSPESSASATSGTDSSTTPSSEAPSGSSSEGSSAASSAATSSNSATQQSQQTTTPTSAAPTTSAAPSATAQSTPATSTAAPAEAPAPTTAAPATAAETTAAEPTAAEPTTAEPTTAAAESETQPSAVVTTTVVIPVPVPAAG